MSNLALHHVKMRRFVSRRHKSLEDDSSPFSLRFPVRNCVVCGDRACSHLYYGVAACHGCKCFFWRTVKSGLSYSCRFDGRCSISTGYQRLLVNTDVVPPQYIANNFVCLFIYSSTHQYLINSKTVIRRTINQAESSETNS
ncbi:unnamed protein product [Heligmosomoides polygyrus]|uniref:Nuclear receptor domain-containing protein n=1 Tax=Heligmosomoides polygyrus TaxID=6339 RepID=A0A3P8CZR1_HELPZ|nr:unnamed protein product [Heligmosomoides polygyrus]